MSSQPVICIVVSVGRTMVAQYLSNAANIFDINTFAIGKGNIGYAPDPSQIYLNSLMQITTGEDLNIITAKSFASPSISEFQCILPSAYVSSDPITELGLYYKSGFPGDKTELGATMFAYATFEGVAKYAGDPLTFTIRVQS